MFGYIDNKNKYNIFLHFKIIKCIFLEIFQRYIYFILTYEAGTSLFLPYVHFNSSCPNSKQHIAIFLV